MAVVIVNIIMLLFALFVIGFVARVAFTLVASVVLAIRSINAKGNK